MTRDKSNIMTRICDIGTRSLLPCGGKRAKLELRLVPNEITARCSRDYVSSPTRLRLVVSLLLIMVLGVYSAWGQPEAGYYYYIANMNAANGGHAYDPSKTDNWYLCPTEGANNNVYYDSEMNKPYLTTNNKGRLTKYIWKVVASGKSGFYYIIHKETGKYLTANDAVLEGNDKHRKRVHLEEVPENSSPSEDMKFSFTSQGATLSVYGVNEPTYAISSKTQTATIGTTVHKYLNPSGSNQNNYGPNSGYSGLIGFYNDATNAGSRWFFEDVVKKPTITDNGNGTATITNTNDEGTIYYKIDDASYAECPSNGVIQLNENHKNIVKAYVVNGDFISRVETVVIDLRVLTDVSSLSEMSDPEGMYRLTDDISSAGDGLNYEFKGSLDGNFHTISGLKGPLFASTDGAVIKNVMLKDVDIKKDGAMGAITGVAKGYTRIYNCGILPSDNKFKEATQSKVKSNNNYCGGLVGWLKDDSRVINCFSYANIDGGTDVAGIVGHNEEVYSEGGVSYGSTTQTSGGKYYRLKTAVVNCMFYGNITSGDNRYPVYGGAKMLNKGTNGINNYCFYRVEASLGLADDEHYNCSWPAKEEYLTSYEYYRSLLNSNRELCGWWIGAPSAPSEMTIAQVQAVPKDASLIAKWVLDPSIAPYPILKPAGKYPSIVNQAPKPTTSTSDTHQRINPETKQWVNRASSSNTQMNNPKAAPETEGQILGTIQVTITDGKNSTNDKIRYIAITAMDIENNDFCYGKIQLPYYNSIFGNPAIEIDPEASLDDRKTQWNSRYGGNYNGDVVVGWIVADVTGGITGITDQKKIENEKVVFDHIFSTNAESGYDFADRYCTTKDKNGNRIFAQGGYYYVPYGVSAITIQAKWATAVYLDNGAEHSYDRISGSGAGTDFAPAGHRSSTLANGQTVNTGTISNIIPTGDVYEKAIVLVGNHQYRIGGANIGDANKGCTIMSADFDMDEEPDYSLIWQLGSGTNRYNICPIRFDFLPVVEIGMAMKEDGSTQYYSLGCYRPLGHFEVTETSLIHFGQFEYGTADRNTSAPLILNGGIFDQYSKGTKSHTDAEDYISYIIIGGNVSIPSFTPGAHVNTGAAYPTRHCPINVIGGKINNLYLTGNYNDGVTPNTDNPHCYIDGGNFKQVAAAGKEGINGNVIFKVNHSIMQEFYGGSTLGDKYVTGSIDVTIDNSYVTKYCGGPKFSNLTPSASNTVTTNATGTTFGVYYGGGNGGTSYMQYDKADATVTDATPTGTFISWDDATQNRGGRLKYYTPGTFRSDAPIGYHANYEMEIVNTSTGEDSKKAIFRTYMYVAQFSATNTGPVTNNLTDCTVLTNFYGGGNLGGVHGNVTSTLLGTTHVNGSVYGAGYSASVPQVTIYDKNKTAPMINVYTGIITPTPDPDPASSSTTYTWCYKNSSTNVVIPSGVVIPNAVSTSNPTFEYNGKNYLYTKEKLENLGTVEGTVSLTIGGDAVVEGKVYKEDGSEDATKTGGVYGGGDESAVDGSVTVTLSGNAQVFGNVFGGGNQGEVSGSTTVNIQDE